jgi:hypothetical protein
MFPVLNVTLMFDHSLAHEKKKSFRKTPPIWLLQQLGVILDHLVIVWLEG